MNEKPTENDMLAEANRRTGDTAIYLYYVRSVGWVPTLIFVGSITIFIFGQLFPSKRRPFRHIFSGANQRDPAWWVKEWASFNKDHPNEKLGLYLGVYGSLGVIALLFLVISCW